MFYTKIYYFVIVWCVCVCVLNLDGNCTSSYDNIDGWVAKTLRIKNLVELTIVNWHE